MRTIEEAYGLLFRERERWDTALGEFVATRTFQDLDSLRTSSHESLAGIALASVLPIRLHSVAASSGSSDCLLGGGAESRRVGPNSKSKSTRTVESFKKRLHTATTFPAARKTKSPRMSSSDGRRPSAEGGGTSTKHWQHTSYPCARGGDLVHFVGRQGRR